MLASVVGVRLRWMAYRKVVVVVGDRGKVRGPGQDVLRGPQLAFRNAMHDDVRIAGRLGGWDQGEKWGLRTSVRVPSAPSEPTM